MIWSKQTGVWIIIWQRAIPSRSTRLGIASETNSDGFWETELLLNWSHGTWVGSEGPSIGKTSGYTWCIVLNNCWLDNYSRAMDQRQSYVMKPRLKFIVEWHCELLKTSVQTKARIWMDHYLPECTSLRSCFYYKSIFVGIYEGTYQLERRTILNAWPT